MGFLAYSTEMFLLLAFFTTCLFSIGWRNVRPDNRLRSLWKIEHVDGVAGCGFVHGDEDLVAPDAGHGLGAVEDVRNLELGGRGTWLGCSPRSRHLTGCSYRWGSRCRGSRPRRTEMQRKWGLALERKWGQRKWGLALTLDT